ncbi:hypothetical protein BWD09_11920 [Neisseria dentiae]|uniref:Uncharacterized protein n=2 Tax=Neisseria dentiae TaxID=194197 RepID=A0A1X3D2B5_9NEIS|nr:hypothetical protein [Neisseria dentiae]OSI13916.1 hypothetical protein BWD09_11920 [Neisseria dentiae]
MGQSVPTVDDNSGAIKGNTENIAQYLKDLKEFFGAGSNDPLKNNNGFGLSGSLAGDANSVFGSMASNGKDITEKSMLNSNSLTGSAAEKYYGSNESSVCNDPSLLAKGKSALTSAITGKDSTDPETRMYQACNSARNLIALQLQEIFDIITILEKRNNQLRTFLNEGYNNSGDVQKKQYQIAVMQALIQNDMTRLQAALAAYQTKTEFYKQVQAEAQWEILYGKKTANNALQQTFGSGGNVTANSVLQGLGEFDKNTAGVISGGAGVAAATATAASLEAGNLFDSLLSSIGDIYDSVKKKLGINS